MRWLIPAVDCFPHRQKSLLDDRVQTTTALAGPERQVEATFTRSRGWLLNQMSSPGAIAVLKEQ